MVHLHRTQSEHWMEIIPRPKWVRVVLGGAVIADSKAVATTMPTTPLAANVFGILRDPASNHLT